MFINTAMMWARFFHSFIKSDEMIDLKRLSYGTTYSLVYFIRLNHFQKKHLIIFFEIVKRRLLETVELKRLMFLLF